MPEPDLNPQSVPCMGLRELGDDYVECTVPAEWLVGQTPACSECIPTFLDDEGATKITPLHLPEADFRDYRAGMCWVPASEGEPPVTDTRFAVLLISSEALNLDTKEKFTFRFLRPHYPGAKKPVPADCHWLLLPPLPEGT